ncbi:hypothetical protein KVJ46_001365 [Enterococcus faecalis]|uniref:hypothetical protein n=1 Tax=Enterococcus faecalis TaxID=1351 RepID=UPI00067E2DC6|nr:hypothetical protein [Enterococcus faecalis]EGO9051636.1 hypothetical protein [Enterococcus faecalis]EHH3130691.1 hypothetical protein [Enterococcus faecalis]EHS2085476.1 hypothetical protein [Enterococcus faecalis]HAP2777970.1 hypothetical protein [Enterococcus faecalis]
MSKPLNSYAVGQELDQVKHLLFFMGETFTSIQNTALRYRKQDPDADKLLAASIDRSIDQLITLQATLFNKVMELEQNFVD